ncbi:hypothetical protein SBP28_000218 [Candidozyma auris]
MSSPVKAHQFTHSNAHRRDSAVYGSVGKQGLFLPSDFLHGGAVLDESFMDDDDTYRRLLDDCEQQRRVSCLSQDIIDEEREVLRIRRIIPAHESDENIPSIFENAVNQGKIRKVSHSVELVSLMRSSLPLVCTFLLQNSLSTVSVFTVGHLGAVELAAVSMGSMTANITGYATIQGIATALDTLCPQAFGAQRYHLVGDYMQKCVALIAVVICPILIIWVFFGYQLITLLLPDKSTAVLAAAYLRYISFGIPAYVLFECGKRFLQAQGIYHVATYVLLFASPSNLVMNIIFVKLFGYLGAPIAVAINYWLMAGGLLFATLLLDESSTLSGIHPLRCWTGLHLGRAFSDWGKLLKLAIPGWTMLEAEFLAFEILTLMSSYLGTIELAAQSVGSTMASLTYQVPFAMGIAASTRIANYLGAGLSECAKATSEVSLGFGFCVSLVNFLALYSMQGPIATLFTTDEKVIAKLHEIMWLVALMQISDAMNANSAGCLRGQGLTKIGGIVNLVSYYVVGIPLSIYLSFYSPWRGSLHGLWIGTTVALTLIGVIQTYVVLSADSEQLCKDARDRTSESV